MALWSPSPLSFRWPTGKVDRKKSLSKFPGKKQSKKQSSIVSTVVHNMSNLLRSEGAIILFYTLLSLYLRVFGIGNNNRVVWDEAHFGKFASYYLNREFYFDVHPPLGKMIVAGVGKIVGYTGNFTFESGAEYPEDLDYVGMRMLLSVFGAAMVPLAYSTSSGFGWSPQARHLLALMVLVDNGWLVISRFILLDSMLLFFTFATVFGMVHFSKVQKSGRHFSPAWFFWLFFTGLMLGCVCSVKWVGAFATALVGIYTMVDLWAKLGETSMTPTTYVRHWLFRSVALIVVPFAVYVASFKAHFTVLNKSGPGDAQMSSLFQANLQNASIARDSPIDVAFGSRLTLKNNDYGGGLLHSHIQTYPEGSKQQQVTTYHHRDINNEFFVQRKWGEHPKTELAGPQLLRSGDTIRLLHAQTSRSLHSHQVPAPLSKLKYEVSCYGNATFGDIHDYWTVELLDDVVTGERSKTGDPVRTLTSRMRLRHETLGCYLSSGHRNLPEWGFKQTEVFCDQKSTVSDAQSHWTVEDHWNDELPARNVSLPRPPFWRSFIHLNVAMMRSNNGLVADPDKEDLLVSKPMDWPFLYNGLRMNSWEDDSIKYYMMGNPLIWWGSSISLFVFVALWAYYQVSYQRGNKPLSDESYRNFIFVGGQVAGLGWLLHFVPFLIMGRVMYLHHYLPTLYFAVIMFSHVLDHLLWNTKTAAYLQTDKKRAWTLWVKHMSFLILAASILAISYHFRMTALGFRGPAVALGNHKWRSSWNIHD